MKTFFEVIGTMAVVYFVFYIFFQPTTRNFVNVRGKSIPPAKSLYWHRDVSGYEHLKVIVTEIRGSNIEFKVNIQGSEVYESGVYSGRREAIIDIKEYDPADFTVEVSNLNLIESKACHVQIIGLRESIGCTP